MCVHALHIPVILLSFATLMAQMERGSADLIVREQRTLINTGLN